MKIYMSEKDMPKDGVYNLSIDNKGDGIDKVVGSISTTHKIITLVQFESLEQLKQEVRREFAERLKASVCENAYTVYYDKFSSDNGMTEDGFAELIDNLLKQYEVEE